MPAPPERSRKMMPVPKHVLDHLDRFSWPDPGTRTGRAARWRVLERVLVNYDYLLVIHGTHPRPLPIHPSESADHEVHP